MEEGADIYTHTHIYVYMHVCALLCGSSLLALYYGALYVCMLCVCGVCVVHVWKGGKEAKRGRERERKGGRKKFGWMDGN